MQETSSAKLLTAVIRHLGSSLFVERIRQYQKMKGFGDDYYGFSERDLVTFFRGEHREMQCYIVDSVRDQITHSTENRLKEFVEWSGKGADRPLAYSTIERAFFAECVYKSALDSPIDDGVERGENPRFLERDQLIRLMNLFADVFFVGQWDPEIGGRKIEYQVQKGTLIAESHLRAWRIAREEVMGAILQWVRLVVENYFAWTGQMTNKERLFQKKFPEDLWRRIELFIRNLGALPCWIDKQLSQTVFGAKQNREFWLQVFKTGASPLGVRVLALPLDLNRMIQETPDVQKGIAA